MSYAFTIPLRGLGVSASASINVATDVKSGASVSKTTQDAAKAAGVELPDCSDAAVTGNDYLDSTAVKCCEEIKKMTGKSKSDMAIAIGQCGARGAATGACMAAGVVTFGVTTALAPLCGTIGAAVYDRVVGWDTTQWVAAGVGAAVCSAVSAGVAGPLCAFAAAELIGWITDVMGPVFDGIFNPSAAKDRELAARKAFHSLTAAREDLLLQADQAVRELWSNSIKSIKSVYQESVGLLPASYQAKAQQILGFAPKYDGIAKALVAAGVRTTPMGWAVDGKGATVGDRLRWRRDHGDGYGCESTADGCLKDGYSEACPFSFSDLYMVLYYSSGMDKLTGNTRDKQVAFEKQSLQTMQALASVMLPTMQQSIAIVATRVATVVAGLKQQALIEEAKAMDDAKLVAKAVAAAEAAEKAAADAKSWSGKKRALALTTVQQRYAVATQTRALMTYAATPGAAPASASNQKKVGDAVSRASAAVKLAQSNAQSAQIMVGGTVAAGVVGIGYLLLRRA